MQKHILNIGLFFLIFISCQNNSDKKNIGVSFDEPVAALAVLPIRNWDQLEPGVHISWGSSNNRYQREYIPEEHNEEVFLTAWKGERVNAQMVAWAKDSVSDLTFEIPNLKSPSGVINSNSIKYFFVRNVISDGYYAKHGSKDSIQLVADCLVEAEAYNMREKTSRGIWFNIDVPYDAAPGEYKTDINVWANGNRVKTLKLTVLVQNQLLPEPKDWKIHLDLWQNPFAVARYYNVELWSEEHFEIMKPLYKVLANAGQKCITATIMHKPWGWVTYDYFGSMVKHIKKADGSWEFDYTIFDKWVSFMMDLGITEQINCYTLVPWIYKFSYFDETTGKDTSIFANPISKEYAEYWTPFLKSFKIHLKEKGWYDITTVAMDERPMDEMASAFNLVNKYLGVKIASAANYTPEFSEKVYDYSVLINYKIPTEMLENRKKKNLLTTYYICLVPEYPNNFTFSPPAEGIWQGWYAFAKDFDGILRWAYNSWNENPLQDTRHEKWPSGDAFLVYPNSYSSIRFEKLREGIQDFEKLKIITQKLELAKTDEADEKLKMIDDVLKEFEIEKIGREGALAQVQRAKSIMNKVSE
jgi:hypothetical protein